MRHFEGSVKNLELYCNKMYFLHILMWKWLLGDIPIRIYDSNIAMDDIIQINFTKIWAHKIS